VHAGLMIGFFWVATSFAINYSFAQRSLKLWLIDAGYHLLQFALYGVILGLWH
jgi:CRISPR/Cas system-associated protein endoribonuclease Cas2